jgi:hypothetical protein
MGQRGIYNRKQAVVLFAFTTYRVRNHRCIYMLDALWIVILGMAIIFAVLGLLLGMMILLNRLIKPPKTD